MCADRAAAQGHAASQKQQAHRPWHVYQYSIRHIWFHMSVPLDHRDPK